MPTAVTYVRTATDSRLEPSYDGARRYTQTQTRASTAVLRGRQHGWCAVNFGRGHHTSRLGEGEATASHHEPQPATKRRVDRCGFMQHEISGSANALVGGKQPMVPSQGRRGR